MRANLALSTRIGVAVLISLTLVTAAVTAFVITNPQQAVSNMTAPATTTYSTPSALPGSESSTFVFDAIASGAASSSRLSAERSFADLLPNRLFTSGNDTPAPLAAGIAVGTISNVTGCSALAADGMTEVPYSTEHVGARTVLFDVLVSSGFGVAGGRSSVTVGLTVSGDMDGDRLISSLESVGSAIVVFDAAGDFDSAPGVYSIRGGGTLLGTVDPDGTISFPALGDDGPDFIGSLATVGALTAESTRSVDIGTIENGVIVTG
jgi:hypothetical protein